MNSSVSHRLEGERVYPKFQLVEKEFIPEEVFRRSVARLRIVSNFGDSGEIHARARENGLPRGDAPRRGSLFARACVDFAGITKIRDYSQSTAWQKR